MSTQPNSLNSHASNLNQHNVGVQLEQLADSLSNSHFIDDAAHVYRAPETPHAFEIPSEITMDENGQPEIELDGGSYGLLAVSLLLTCAEDLVDAKKILENPRSSEEKIQQAKVMVASVKLWLLTQNEGEAPYSYDSCITLLESELHLRALHDQIHIPEIAKQPEFVAHWILENPEHARKTLRSYMISFRNTESVNPAFEQGLDEDNAAETLPRPRG